MVRRKVELLLKKVHNFPTQVLVGSTGIACYFGVRNHRYVAGAKIFPFSTNSGIFGVNKVLLFCHPLMSLRRHVILLSTFVMIKLPGPNSLTSK